MVAPGPFGRPAVWITHNLGQGAANRLLSFGSIFHFDAQNVCVRTDSSSIDCAPNGSGQLLLLPGCNRFLCCVVSRRLHGGPVLLLPQHELSIFVEFVIGGAASL